MMILENILEYNLRNKIKRMCFRKKNKKKKKKKEEKTHKNTNTHKTTISTSNVQFTYIKSPQTSFKPYQLF